MADLTFPLVAYIADGRPIKEAEVAAICDALNRRASAAPADDALRDAEWNKAIEAAAERVQVHMLGREHEHSKRMVSRIRALRRDAGEA